MNQNANWWFCKGYSLLQRLEWILHDGRFSKWSRFSNISRFFEVFFSHNNSKLFVEWIVTCFFGISIFDPKWRFFKGYNPLHDGRFSKWSHFSNIWCFFGQFFAQNNWKWFVEWTLTCFLELKFFTQNAKWGFCKG